MKVSVQITRKGDARQALSVYQRRLAAKVQTGMVATGDKVLEESHKLVPIDTAALKGSSGVRVEGALFDAVVVVFYGRKGDVFVGPSDNEGKIVERIPYDYAVRVHNGVNGPAPGMAYPAKSGEDEYLRKPTYNKQDELRAVLNSHLV